MVKILKLLKNENKKELKKISTKIFIAAAIFTIILAVIFVRFIYWLNDIGTSFISENWKDNLQVEINESIKINIQDAKEAEDLTSQKNYETIIKIYNFALENDINVYSPLYKDWKVTGLNEFINKSFSMQFFIEGNDIKNQEENERLEELFTLIKNDDYLGYVNSTKKWLDKDLENGAIPNEVYESKKEEIELKEKYEIGKGNNQDVSWKLNLFDEIISIKSELNSNIDSYTKKVLTYEQKENLENRLKIDIYRLEKNIAPFGLDVDEANYRSYFDSFAKGFSMLVISVLVIMMAGGAIGTEYSKGTIKFLVMTPNKRWKILLAKLINIVLIMVILTIIVAFVSIIVGNIFFANYEVSPYLYVQNGEVCELNHVLYVILDFLVEDIELFVYMLFALMISAVTRNTAAAIGLSLGTYMGNGIFMTIINTFVKYDWIRFIPFNNFNLSSRIFTNTSVMLPSTSSDIVGNTPVWFSFIVLGVCSILMIVTMFDSFNKKDIK